jgi:hypothetical protein
MYACVNVFGALCPGFVWFIAPGIGCVILECSEDVRFGMMRLSSSRLVGRDSPERGLEVKDGGILKSESKSRSIEGGFTSRKNVAQ